MEKRLPLAVLLFCIILHTATNAQWKKQAEALKKRSETTSVVYGGRLYTFLGFKDAGLNPEPSVEVFDPKTNKWTLLSSIPEGKAVTHQGVVLIDDNVWHIGGRVGKHPGPLTSEIWIYNISSNTWSQGPQILDPQTGTPLSWGAGGAALLGRTLHLFGGFINTACRGDQDRFHLTLDVDAWLANPSKPAAWQNARASMPVKRNHFGTVVLGGKIYAIGGQFGHDCGGGQDQRWVHVYDPATDIWKELTPLPMARSHIEGSSFAMDGKIYIIAGQGEGGENTNLVTVFDPSAKNGMGAWSNQKELALPARYEGLSAKPIGNTIYITHGGEGSSRHTRNTVFARTINRNPVHQLGFTTACSSFSVAAGEQVGTQTLLFTYDGTAQYSTSSNAGWLSVVKNPSGTVQANGTEVGLQVNTTGLAPGQYKAQITAQGSGADGPYMAASYCVNLTVKASNATITATPELVFSTVQGRKSKIQGVQIFNKGNGDLVISALNIAGLHPQAFALNNPPALPFKVAAGKSQNIELVFDPPSGLVGSLSANLNIGSNDAANGTLPVQLYGLSAKGEQGGNEPPLNDVVQTLGYNINVGGKELILGTQSTAIGEEVLAPLFQKAGSGKASIKAVARYSTDGLLPFGYYTSQEGEAALNEIGLIALKQEQTLYPLLQSGSEQFDPGNAVFGLYAGAAGNAQGIAYTEDRLNTGPFAHAARIYPLKDRAGKPVASSYLVAFGTTSNGDYQDYVFVVSNVKPVVRQTGGVLEAELALLHGAEASTNNKGYSGPGFADFKHIAGDYVEWTLNRDEAGPVVLAIKYANGQLLNKKGRLEVNGTLVRSYIPFKPTGAWANWSAYMDTVELVKGPNTIRLSAYDHIGPDVDYLSWQVLNPAGSGMLEAEAASLTGPVVASAHPGYTGTGFADFQQPQDEFIEWMLPLDHAGPVTLSFKYANGSRSSRPKQLEINGTLINQPLAFAPTGSWAQWKYESISVNLLSGANRIRIRTTGAGGANIDHLSWQRDGRKSAVAAGRNNRWQDALFSINVWPNPASTTVRLMVQSISAQPITVSVFDASGRLQTNQVFKNDTRGLLDLPVSNLAPGIYIIKVKQGASVATTQLAVAQR